MKTDWIAGLLGPWSAELTLGSIFLRLAVSMVLAAIIGCERSSKHVYPCEPRGHGHDAH